MDWRDPGTITTLQADRLKEWLGPHTPTAHLSFEEAERLIRLHDPNAAWRRLPPTAAQEKFLTRRGLWSLQLWRGDASDLIAKIKEREKRA